MGELTEILCCLQSRGVWHMGSHRGILFLLLVDGTIANVVREKNPRASVYLAR